MTDKTPMKSAPLDLEWALESLREAMREGRYERDRVHPSGAEQWERDVKFAIDEIESRLRAGGEVSPWKSIDSAPRDGTPILVCYAGAYACNGFLPIGVRWRNYHPNSNGREAFRQSNGNKVEVATHWMPLPPPPAKEGER